MTTIRERQATICGGEMDVLQEELLDYLGIDPDTPAELATEGKCIVWLRERGWHLYASPKMTNGEPGRGSSVLLLSEREGARLTVGDHETLHAALIAACQAVQEAGQ